MAASTWAAAALFANAMPIVSMLISISSIWRMSSLLLKGDFKSMRITQPEAATLRLKSALLAAPRPLPLTLARMLAVFVLLSKPLGTG